MVILGQKKTRLIIFFVFIGTILLLWNDLENKIISYADDTTLYVEVAYCKNVANSLKRDLDKIQL